MRKEKEIVKKFYESFGWDRNEAGVYKDTACFVDQRPPIKGYNHKVLTRARNFLRTHGEYFLDVGSGPIPNAKLLQYSSDFKWCVCVDLSRVALTEARSNLGQKGLYVQADLTNLPFKDGAFEAVLASHVLYHIPQDEQESAVLEFYRTMATGGLCVIIYMSKTSPSVLLRNARRIIAKVPGLRLLWTKTVKPILSKREYNNNEEEARPFLYSHTYHYRWFRKTFPQSWDMDIRVWSCVDLDFTKTFVPNNFLGFVLMKFIFWLEIVFPHALLRISRYPMIIIRKK